MRHDQWKAISIRCIEKMEKFDASHFFSYEIGIITVIYLVFDVEGFEILMDSFLFKC